MGISDFNHINAHLDGPVDLSKPPPNLENTVLTEKPGIISFPMPLVNIRGHARLETSDDTMEMVKARTEHTDSHFVLIPQEGFVQHGVRILSPVERSANHLVRAINQGQDEGYLQRAYLILQEQLARRVIGKDGLLNRYIAGQRFINSVSFVCTGCPDLIHDQILLPADKAQLAKIQDGDLCLVFRNPVLHEQSMVFLKAVVSNQCTTGALPYIVFQGFAADCDGDMISVVKMPQCITRNEKLLDLIKKDMATTYQQSHFHDSLLFYRSEPGAPPDRYFISMCPACGTGIHRTQTCECGKELEAGNFMNGESFDKAYRLQTDGLSIGPEDVLNRDESVFLKQVEESGAKKEKELFEPCFWGQTDLRQCSEDYLDEQMAIKLKLGFIGYAGTNALYAATINRKDAKLARAACHFKEMTTQQLLDCKHGSDISGMEDILNAINRRGSFKEAQRNEVVEFLGDKGYDTKLMKRLVDEVWPLGLQRYVNVNSPMRSAITSSKPMALVQMLEREDKGGVGRHISRTLQKFGVL